MVTTRWMIDPVVMARLEDEDSPWELWNGQLEEKPGMAAEHTDLVPLLLLQLAPQLDRRLYKIKAQHVYVVVPPDSLVQPDLLIIPTALERPFRGGSAGLERYADPLPLVGEIWSPSTGTSDLNRKVPGYQRRGDHEIWRLHPYERTLTTWRRQPDGRYVERVHHGGVITLAAIPGVALDLDALFAALDMTP
jgi:Uma2 family endonuclease